MRQPRGQARSASACTAVSRKHSRKLLRCHHSGLSILALLRRDDLCSLGASSASYPTLLLEMPAFVLRHASQWSCAGAGAPSPDSRIGPVGLLTNSVGPVLDARFVPSSAGARPQLVNSDRCDQAYIQRVPSPAPARFDMLASRGASPAPPMQGRDLASTSAPSSIGDVTQTMCLSAATAGCCGIW